MRDKHYENEGFSFRVKTVRSVTVRLCDKQLNILAKRYPGKSLSFAIRSAINALEKS